MTNSQYEWIKAMSADKDLSAEARATLMGIASHVYRHGNPFPISKIPDCQIFEILRSGHVRRSSGRVAPDLCKRTVANHPHAS